MSDEVRRKATHARGLVGRRNGYADHSIRADSRARGRSNRRSSKQLASDTWDTEASLARSYKLIEEIYGSDWRTQPDSGVRPPHAPIKMVEDKR